MASDFEPMAADLRSEMSEYVRGRLADLGPAPWENPGYEDRVEPRFA